ncbi:MAG: GGDEF domain-containing protein [Butyrivibrio sp.]|nr:GGDEF domain-containing protein [Butyrivibrio sp.]
MINGKRIIALCTYGIYEAQEFDFLSELGKIIPEHDCFLFIYAMNSEIGIIDDSSAEVKVFDLIPYDRVDVVVIMNEKIKSRTASQSIIDSAHKANVPVVVVDGEFEDVSMVRYDYAEGFEKVVRHVIDDHKSKKPHFMAGHRNNVFSTERINVFKKVLADNNMSFDDSMVSYGDFWALPCRAATAELLKRDELPDSIICANDIMAINVCDVLNEAGIRVPNDILVSGFDGIDEAFLSSPGITTAICDMKELAHDVMDTLDEVLSGSKKVIKWAKPLFIPNESCGCPKKDLHITATVSELNNLFYHHEDDVHAMQSIISKFMMGKEIRSSLRYLKENQAKYALVVVEKSCFDLENNFFYDDGKEGEKIVILDPYDENDDSYPYDPSGIVPHLDKIMETGQPIIFNCLIYMDKCLGFVCYSYPRTMLIDYNQTPNLTNCFEMSVGGYVVTRYQNYLRDKLQEMYQNDALTGLYNRLAFINILSDILSKPDTVGKEITIIVMDLNGLKQINDNFGHLEGDKAIKAVADALRLSCPEEALCVRTGGDEMLALIFDGCDVEKIQKNIESILKERSKEVGFDVSASLGSTSTIYEEGMDINRLVAIADDQMYRMKRKTKEGH